MATELIVILVLANLFGFYMAGELVRTMSRTPWALRLVPEHSR